MVRADMESAHGAPIGTSGRHRAAGRVIGVSPCGCDPVCHDGRSVSAQAVEGNSGDSNSRSRLIHGAACAAPSIAQRAARWISRVHRAEPQAAMANDARSGFWFGGRLGAPKNVPSRKQA